MYIVKNSHSVYIHQSMNKAILAHQNRYLAIQFFVDYAIN